MLFKTFFFSQHMMWYIYTPNVNMIGNSILCDIVKKEIIVFQYVLLLKNIAKMTLPSHKDKTGLQSAIDQLHVVLSEVDKHTGQTKVCLYVCVRDSKSERERDCDLNGISVRNV